MSGFRTSYLPTPQFGQRPPTPVAKVMRQNLTPPPAPVQQFVYKSDEEDNWPRAAKEIDRADLFGLPTKIRAQVLVLRAARKHRIDPSLIFSPRRQKHIIQARFEAIAAVAQACPLWSLPRLGAFFNRDHTSILHCLRRMGVTRG